MDINDKSEDMPASDAGKDDQAVIRGLRSQQHILVVDDTPANQMLMEMVLKKAGFQVSTAVNGKVGVDKAGSQHFDLILMDMQMPVMDGYEAVLLLRKNGFMGPIIALTANTMTGEMDKCIAVGCDEYMAKPIDTKILSDTIDKYLVCEEDAIETRLYSIQRQIDVLNDLCSAGSPIGAEITRKNGEFKKALVDWEKAMKYCGDEANILRTAKSILTDSPEFVGLLENAVNDQNLKDIILYAHRLRGVSLIIGTSGLAEAANKVEKAADRKDIKAASELMDTVRHEFKKLTSFLSDPGWVEKAKAEVRHGRDRGC